MERQQGKDTWFPPTPTTQQHSVRRCRPHLRFRDGRKEGGGGGYWYKGLRGPRAVAARGVPCSSRRLLREGPGSRGDEGRGLGHAHQGQSQHAHRPHLCCQINGGLKSCEIKSVGWCLEELREDVETCVMGADDDGEVKTAARVPERLQPTAAQDLVRQLAILGRTTYAEPADSSSTFRLGFDRAHLHLRIQGPCPEFPTARPRFPVQAAPGGRQSCVYPLRLDLTEHENGDDVGPGSRRALSEVRRRRLRQHTGDRAPVAATAPSISQFLNRSRLYPNHNLNIQPPRSHSVLGLSLICSGRAPDLL